jgi:hypothetical protein
VDGALGLPETQKSRIPASPRLTLSRPAYYRASYESKERLSDEAIREVMAPD